MNSAEIHTRIDADFGDSRYSLYIGRNIIARIENWITSTTNDKRILIVADRLHEEIVDDLLRTLLQQCGFQPIVYYIKGGKKNKSFHQALKIYGVLEENDFARDSTLIALGGGVVGDLVGFVASTYLRGIHLVHIPTTLMAMIDSSIGGKVAINFRNTINGIGNYYHPVFTIIDLNFIDTLPVRDFNAGLAEVIKCAIISDAKFLKTIFLNSEKIKNRDEESLIGLIAQTIRIKIDFVRHDVKEQKKRLKLNYGHTLGHAVEMSTQGATGEIYRHGEGVSLGMVAASLVSSAYYNDVSYDHYKTHTDILGLYDLPTTVESAAIGYDRTKLIQQCLRNVYKDKKRIDGKLRMILVKNIGEAEIVTNVRKQTIEDVFQRIIA